MNYEYYIDPVDVVLYRKAVGYKVQRYDKDGYWIYIKHLEGVYIQRSGVSIKEKDIAKYKMLTVL